MPDNQNTPEPQMTAVAFFESVWFRGIARTFMLVALPALFAVAGMLAAVLNDQSNVRTTLAIRSADSERFQSSVERNFAEVKKEQDAQGVVITQLQQDVATIKGLLLRQDIAQRVPAPL